MRGPAVDLGLLSLMILFFGVQQRKRPQLYFRFWFVGWIFVALSYFVWEPILRPGLLATQEVVRFDLLLVGVLAFLLSFLAEQDGLRRTVLRGLAIGVPGVLAIDIAGFAAVPKLVLAVVVVLWQGYGIYSAHKVLPREWRWRRGLLDAICAGAGVGLLVYIRLVAHPDLNKWTVAEVLLCSAVLYGGEEGGGGVSKAVGMLGFVVWAGFDFVDPFLSYTSHWGRVLFAVWNIPRYAVGFAMISRVFEETTRERAQIAEGYKQLYEDFHLVYESHPHPMWIYDPGTRMILSANMAASETYGYTRDELLGMHTSELEMAGDAESEMIERMVEPPPDGLRTRYRHKDGHPIWVNTIDHAVSFHGRGARLELARDITKRMKMNRELVHRAHHDALTGLPNRMLLGDRIEECLERCEREGRKAVLLTIDVDHFKLVNDTYGHLIGDECLKLVAARLASKVRKIDTIARVGGEEFAAIIGGIGCVEDAEKIAASLLRQFEEPLQLPGMELGLTVSVGGAIYPDHGADMVTLREESDRALYAAKRAGRNRAQFSAVREVPAGR